MMNILKKQLNFRNVSVLFLIVYFAVFLFYPIYKAFAGSLHDWNPLTQKYNYIGWENYRFVLEDKLFWKSLTKLLADRAGAHRSALVTHTDGNIVYGEGENEPRAAASAMKVLTYLALAHSIDLGTRFKTSVARNGNELTLIAGGNTMLGAGNFLFILQCIAAVI